MNKKLCIGFLVSVSGRWPRELPSRRLSEYGSWIKDKFTDCNVTVYEKLLCTHEEMQECISLFKENEVDLVIQVYGAFTGDDICCGISDAVRVPMILWAPREESWVRDERLYANALCCATMNGASLNRLGAAWHILYGNKEETQVEEKLRGLVGAYSVIHRMAGMTYGLFGYRVTAFYNCAFDEVLIRKTFGINMEETDLKVIFDRMEELPDEKVKREMDYIAASWDTSGLPEGHLENHARLYLVLKELMKEQQYAWAAVKCWPEMGNLHTTPCAVLGRLADEGILISCEADVDAGLASVVENLLTGLPTFITDLINIDEKENTVTFWHCGNGAPSLHNPEDGVSMCNHPLAGQGTAFWCSLKPGPVTAARLSNINGRYVLFLLRGEAVPTVRNTRGTMVNVKVSIPVDDLVDKIAETGMSHHYSVVWQDVADQMILVAKLLNIPVVEL
ncbi:MAG: fucose isomerase [Lachnospiraceae bacterium]|nr:fucose isomerase [Lachnospiraceae bacterium]